MSVTAGFRWDLTGAILGAALGVCGALLLQLVMPASAEHLASPTAQRQEKEVAATRSPEPAATRAPVEAPAPQPQDFDDRRKIGFAEHIWKMTKAEDLIRDSHWNPKAIELDETQREALTARLQRLFGPVEAARASWMGATGQESDKARREGNYFRVMASPAGRPFGMNNPDKVDPDQATTMTGLTGPAFSLSIAIVLTPKEFPAVGDLKRSLNRRLLELHDGIAGFFQYAEKR